MADLLSSSLIDTMTNHGESMRFTRSLVVSTSDGDFPGEGFSAYEVDLSDRVIEWGNITFEGYNKHPRDKGKISFPHITMLLDNDDGWLTPGNPDGALPDGWETVTRYSARLVISHEASATELLKQYFRIESMRITNTKTMEIAFAYPWIEELSAKIQLNERISNTLGTINLDQS